MSNVNIASTPDPLTVPTNVGLELLDTTVGLLLNGYVLTMIIYGFIFFQAYIYYNRYPQDRPLLKYVVALLTLMDTAAVAAITESLHFYIIVQFADTFAGVNNATKTYCADNGLAAISVFLVQLGYAHRTFKLGKGHQLVSVFSAGAATGALVLGLIMTARLATHPAFDLLGENPSKALVAIWQTLVFISGIISFCQLCSWQRPSLPDDEKRGRLEASLDVFVDIGVERGAIAALFQLGYVFAFLIAPGKRYWVPFQLICRRLFIVSYLTFLNSRSVIRGAGVYENPSISNSMSTKRSTISRAGMSIGTSIEFAPPSVKDSRSAPIVSFGTRIEQEMEWNHEPSQSEGKEQLVPEH